MNAFELDSLTRELNSIRQALDKSAIVAIADRAGNITHVNDLFCEISKYSRSELLGKNHRIIKSDYHSKDFFVDLWKTISNGKTWVGEVCNRAKDGSHYWVHTTIVPFLDQNGKPEKYVSIRFEITQRKKAEEKIVSYSKRLELSNRELQDFASVAAHDLQEPLRKIQAFSDRLIVKYQSSLVDEAKDFLNRMQNSAKRMQVLIEDLLTFSRVTTKAQPFTPTDLKQIVQEVLSDLEVRIEQTEAIIEIGNLPIIDADASQMRQLFQNLIVNAIKFHKKEVQPHIKITSSIHQNHCEIQVKDNGIGFEIKYLDRIFTIFQRLHGRNEYEGTGVGLAVCRRIAERHNGSITAQSTLGNGAVFLITLPVKQKKGDFENEH